MALYVAGPVLQTINMERRPPAKWLAFSIAPCIESFIPRIVIPTSTPIMRTWYGRGRSLQVAVTSCCLVAFVLFGYDQGVFSGIIGNEDWRKQFGYPNDSEEGIIVSCYNLGCLLGCLSELYEVSD